MFSQLIVVLAVLSVVSANVPDYLAKFYDWKVAHPDVHIGDGTLFTKFFKNFVANDEIIEKTNSMGLTYTLGHNDFSHLSNAEFNEMMNLGQSRMASNATAPFVHGPVDVSTLATSVDWTTSGAVTGVKDQGQCGSCWSFSTTGALEGAYYNKYKSLVSFSEQNLVDCDKRTGSPRGTDMGCNGGLMDSAFTWTKANGGLCTEAAYPYTAKDGTCLTSCAKNANVAPASYTDVTVNSDSAMMSALNKQTVAVAIQADQSAFQLYKSGVFTAACGTSLDHGVLAVGYGTYTDGLDYYKVKNSWGTSWGMSGYILFARGASLPSAQKQGQCGILSGPPSYPNL